jgi:hypothetical protein
MKQLPHFQIFSAPRLQRHGFFLLLTALLFSFSNCSPGKTASGKPVSGNHPQHLLLRDEGLSQLSYEDLANPANNWWLPVPAGRDMQLVGNGRVLIGTGYGYEEREIGTGKLVGELNDFPGTVCAHRLPNGNTLLAGINWQGKQGIVLIEAGPGGEIKNLIVYPGFDYVRLVRQTITGNFLVTAGKAVFEGRADGSIVWQAAITGSAKPNAWQALRLRNGNTIVSTGYAKNFQVFGADGKLLDTITGPAAVNPNFFAGFQVLANGNYVVTNWQGHGPKFGASGVQVLEYTPAGQLAWSWKQDAGKHSSLQGIIVLDGLNTDLLHVEDADGKLAPVK